jgi:ubiquinone biosynthesis UbiH/UbiF/VisC/COQ6 family hydroxylase
VQSRLAPYIGMAVWDANSDGALTFNAASLGREHLGTIVEHGNLALALNTVCAARRDIVRLTASVRSIDYGAESLHLGLDSGTGIDASLVVACDGAHSPLRQLLGIGTSTRSFGQTALACNVEVSIPHGNIARQRFLATGPVAFLPLASARMCGVVWSTTPAQAQHLAATSDDYFMTLLTQALGNALGPVRATSERLLVPLRALHAQRYSRGRAVLLGDAAHIVHPLAGQGLNLGIMDAAALAEVFDAGDELDLKFPRVALRRFERMRRGENIAMLNMTSALNRLFRQEDRVTRRARGSGMRFVDRVPPLKQWLMLRAMGEIGDVPKLAGVRGAR